MRLSFAELPGGLGRQPHKRRLFYCPEIRPQGNGMKEYWQSSVLRLVFDCSRRQTEQLFCPQRRCRIFCLGRVPEYTPVAKKSGALLRPKLAYSAHPRKQQQPHRCACAAFRERKRKPKELSSLCRVTLPKAHEPDKKLAGPGVAAQEKKFMRLPWFSPQGNRTKQFK